MSSFAAIQQLQNLILELERSQLGQSRNPRNADQIRKEGKEIDLERAMLDFIDEDVYYTLYRSAKDGIIDPNELLVEAIEETIERGSEFFQIVALALRLGASPNLYVPTVDDDDKLMVVHVLYYAWIITPKSIADMRDELPDINTAEASRELDITHRLLLDIAALLAVANSDIDMPVSDPNILLNRRRKRNGSASQVDVFTDIGETVPTVEVIAKDDSNSILSKDYIEEFYFYKKQRGALVDFVYENPLAAEIVELLDISEAVGVVQLDFEDQQGRYVVEAPFPPLDKCIDVYANKCVEKIFRFKNSQDARRGIITVEDAEDAFVDAADSYNIPVVIALLKFGITPEYDAITRILLRSERKKREGLPASSAALNRMIVEMVERGIGLSDVQLDILKRTSQMTYTEVIQMISKEPFFMRTCRVPGEQMRPDLRKLARELNLEPGLGKSAVCQELMKMKDLDTETLVSVAQKTQQKRLEAANHSFADVVEAVRSNSPNDRASKTVCVNANLLSRPANDYADIDLLRVDEGENTYCFETRDYQRLIEPELRGDIPINPITGKALTEHTIGVIKARLAALQEAGLPVESEGIRKAASRLREPSRRNEYDDYIKGQVELFFDLGADYGIDRDLFLSYDGLTVIEMEELGKILSQDENVIFDIDSRESSVISLAMIVMERVNEISNMEPLIGETPEDLDSTKLEMIDGVFGELYSLIYPPQSN